MDVVYRRCCGLDVHKQTVVACLLLLDEAGRKTKKKREFGTFSDDLRRLMLWLFSNHVTHVAMESTGVYWKPVWNVLEDKFTILLVNPQHMKALPGRKTDQKDSEWIAELLQHGLLRASFIPTREIRELRDLTRLRVHLKQEVNRVRNRVHRILEDANIKVSCVVSDLFGVSGRAMLEAIVRGKTDPGWLADYARGTLRLKKDELVRAFQGHIGEHHRFVVGELLAELAFLEERIARLETEIERRLQTHMQVIERLCTIPGVERITAWTLIAELGLDMSAFADAAHLASWAGLCPGNCESAGKRKTGRTRKGNVYLRRGLCQAAWAASHCKDTYLTALFYRVASRGGVKKAVVAVAHRIAVIAYFLLAEPVVYKELGGDYFDRLHPERTTRRLVRRLEQLGHQVALQPRVPLPPQTALSHIPKCGKRRGRPCKCPERGITCIHKT
jgi:transposase